MSHQSYQPTFVVGIGLQHCCVNRVLLHQLDTYTITSDGGGDWIYGSEPLGDSHYGTGILDVVATEPEEFLSTVYNALWNISAYIYHHDVENNPLPAYELYVAFPDGDPKYNDAMRAVHDAGHGIILYRLAETKKKMCDYCKMFHIVHIINPDRISDEYHESSYFLREGFRFHVDGNTEDKCHCCQRRDNKPTIIKPYCPSLGECPDLDDDDIPF
jgi:hypothetical protein